MDTRLAEELWDGTPDAILAVAAESTFGYSQAEALDQSIGRLIFPADRFIQVLDTVDVAVDAEQGLSLTRRFAAQVRGVLDAAAGRPA